MKHGGNAAILAFVANLLQVEVSTSSSSSSSKASSSRQPSAAFSLRPRRSSCCFVRLEPSSQKNNNAFGRQGPHRPNLKSTRLQHQARVSTFPRYYVSSDEVDQSPFRRKMNRIHNERSVRNSGVSNSNIKFHGEEVLIYKEPASEGEFSLLRPYLEFNEVDIQELFSSERTSASLVAAVGSSEISSSSQLYDELEEVEIGQFRSEPVEQNQGRQYKPDDSQTTSPFYFASVLQEVQPTDAPSFISSATTSHRPLTEDPPKLPPWLSLNQSRFAPMKLRKLQRDLGLHLSSREIEEVVSAIHMASKGDLKKVAGAADFASVLVNSLEMTDVPALCASAFHYCSLVSVRERTIQSTNSPVSTLTECSIEEHACLQSHLSEEPSSISPDAQYLCALAGSGIENFGPHAAKIALDAARLKSVETLAASVIKTKGKLGHLNSDDARNLRSMLLSVNDEGDWRALAIRSAACLYRLEGLEAYRSLMSSTTTENLHRVRCPTHEEARASQEALHIYAPLAARLGMFRLKTELEDAAFRTLYPHSHAMVSALCGGENTNSVGEGMKSVLSDITNQMKRLVHEDTSFMEHIEHVSITARVKEPYSIWRKMLKISKTGDKTLRDISILDIPDAVALRVVFSARKLTPDEPDATTRRRENDLCYYTLDLCTRNWPEMADSRFKDYIKKPKENGYQSLHYSSRKRWRGSEWPFEVQIRTKDMHRVAEYGVAAHWHYKRSDVDGGHEKPKSLSSRIGLDKTSESYLKSRQEWTSKQPDAYRPIPNTEYREPSHYIEDEICRVRKRERDERLKPYLEALSGAQTDIARENVFVFISVQAPADHNHGSLIPSPTEGTVISLPRGSRVLDAVRAAEKWSSVLNVGKRGDIEFVTLKNGQRTSFSETEQLINGDVVCILPSGELVSSKDKGMTLK
mmetsp:Transcript_29255/g.60806  ORF Transcript_29255/g.60806 Transcript_29255/m.60806 type:complete len:919 (+) Transcript_29255:256-3012(+)